MQTQLVWKITYANVVTVTVPQTEQLHSDNQPTGVVSGQQKCESCSLATALYRVKQFIGMSDLDMY